MKTKKCSMCGKNKIIDNFYENRTSGGHSPKCKDCTKIYNKLHPQSLEDKKRYNKKWLKNRLRNDPDYKKRQYKKEVEKRKKNPARFKAQRFFINLYGKNRFKADETFTVDVLEKLFAETKKCQCCNKELNIKPPKIKGAKEHNTASVDRVDNEIGYIFSNIAIICQECNTRKRDLSIKDIEMFTAYMGRFTNV